MQSLVSIAAGIAAAGGLLQTAAPPIGTLRYGSLRYEIRAVHQGAGLGGLPAYCAHGDTDLVMVVYSVRLAASSAKLHHGTTAASRS